MIISASSDYRPAAERILPPFLFHYIDGGSYTETTLKRNVEDLSQIALRQRVLKNMSALNLETKLFNETLSMPVALGPVGLCGMYARRGEVQAARAAARKGIPFTLLTARCGSSFMCCATVGLCAMRLSEPKQRAARRWYLPLICLRRARDTVMPIPA
jgi:isopentenyl diphosphate isomerase/L-lactate dehydrogenase-like FMN-dependent dehydrogenase